MQGSRSSGDRARDFLVTQPQAMGHCAQSRVALALPPPASSSCPRPPSRSSPGTAPQRRSSPSSSSLPSYAPP
eukprot:scaffold119608_cov57-Phaeocystis_antarctica.AAC.1